MIYNKVNNNISEKLINHKTFKTFILILIYRITLDCVYIFGISKLYAYQGFVLDFSFEKYVISIMIILFMLYPMFKLLKAGNTSSLIILLISLFYFVPGTSLMGLVNLDTKYIMLYYLYWLLLVVWQMVLPKIKKSKIKGNPIIFHLLIFGVAIFSLTLSGIYTNFRINLDLSTIYDLRFEARDFNIPVYVEYVKNMSTMIIPIGIIYYIINKNKLYAVALIFIQLLNFSFDGKKSQLAMIFVALLIALFYKRKQLLYVIKGLVLVNIFSLFELILRMGQSEIAHYIIRRVYYMPTLIGFYYFDFFKQNDLLYLKQSLLRYFGFSSPIDEPIQRKIGAIYFGDIDTNANTGLIGDAYSNFGWVSLLIYPLLLVLVIRTLEFASKNVNHKILVLLWVLIAYKFLNGSFFTIMFNGGFIVMVIFMFVCPREKNYINR